MTLWLARLPSAGEPLPPEFTDAVLAPSAQKRLGSIRSCRRRIEYQASRYLLRRLLSLQFKQPLAHWQIEEVDQGPPRVTNLPNGWHFSGSHSRHLCGYVLSRFPVGLDLEYSLRLRDFIGISHFFFSSKEQEALKQAPTAEGRQQLFYRFWTSKEAIFKASYMHAPQALEAIDYFEPTGWSLWNTTLRQFSLCIACAAEHSGPARSLYSPTPTRTFPVKLQASSAGARQDVNPDRKPSWLAAPLTKAI